MSAQVERTSQAVKERPILFSGPMVRAILAGNKRQTRRVLKPQYDGDSLCAPEWFSPAIEDKHGMLTDGTPIFGTYDKYGEYGIRCPYGGPGDRLWVRETWTRDHAEFYPYLPIAYRADGGFEYERTDGKVYSPELRAWFPFKWRPAIFMPRSESRITLEIVRVGIERLNAISEQDILREGMCGGGPPGRRKSFIDLWEKLNGAGSWDSNPWVWVIEFKRLPS